MKDPMAKTDDLQEAAHEPAALPAKLAQPRPPDQQSDTIVEDSFEQ